MEKQQAGQISFLSAVLLSINVMVGAGILYGVGPITAIAGSFSFFAWPVIALVLFPIIWSVAKAADLFPGSGGFYHYCSTGLNPTAGFIAHWGYTLGYIGMGASLMAVIRNWLELHTDVQWIKQYPFIFNFLFSSFYVAINLIPLNKISKIQSVATVLKLLPILTAIVFMFFYFNPTLSFNFNDMDKLGLTFSTVIFAYLGFESCCSIGNLLKDGPKKVASVIFLGFFITVSLYLLFHLALLYIMGPDNLAKEGAMAFPSYLGLSPTLTLLFQSVISAAVLFSWSNSILGISIGSINNIYFLGTNSIMLGSKHLNQLNRHQRPTYAVLWYGLGLFSLTTFVSEIDILFALTNFGVIIAFLFSMAAVFRNRLQQRKYLQLALTVLAFVSSIILIYYIWMQITNAIYIMPLVGGLVVGLVLYKLQQMKLLQSQKEI